MRTIPRCLLFLFCFSLTPVQTVCQEPIPQPAIDGKQDGGVVDPRRAWMFRLDRLSREEWAKAAMEAERLAGLAPQHERLRALAGAYRSRLVCAPLPEKPTVGADGKSIPASPAKPDEKSGVASNGTARATAILGGRYLMVEVELEVGGLPMQAMYLVGYDRLHELYSLSWRDSLSTWSIECLGTADPKDPQRIAMRGHLFDPITPTGRPFRLDLEFVGVEGFSVVVQEQVGEEMAEVMRQEFTRVR